VSNITALTLDRRRVFATRLGHKVRHPAHLRQENMNMAHKYSIEILHEPSFESINYEFYSADEMTADEIFQEFTAQLSIIPSSEEVDAEMCESCSEWTENYDKRDDNGLTLCPKCYTLEG
jgi:formylmethanofuran dehydrogenase subunit E